MRSHFRTTTRLGLALCLLGPFVYLERAALGSPTSGGAGGPVAGEVPPEAGIGGPADDGNGVLDSDLPPCIKEKLDQLGSRARADWLELVPLSTRHDPASKAYGRPYFEAFVSAYGARTVRCDDPLVDRTATLSAPEVERARAWLRTPVVLPPDTAGQRVVGVSGYPLRKVPAGSTELDCRPGQDRGCEAPADASRWLSLNRAVWVGETEVTQALYERFMGHNPAAFQRCGGACPVERVSWFDAVEFANRLSVAEGLEPCYQRRRASVRWPKGQHCLGFRLPVEAEWEVAARGGRADRSPASHGLASVGWFITDSAASPRPVGQGVPNGFGLFDMSGNLWEWTWDVADGGAWAEEAGGFAEGPDRVYRTGSWAGTLQHIQRRRTPGRNFYMPVVRSNSLGFRLVRTAP